MIGLTKVVWAALPAVALQMPAPLARLLEAARGHNPALGVSRAQLAEQEAAAEQALAALLPTVHASGGYTRNQYEAVVSLPANLLGAGPPTELTPLTIQPYNAWSASVGLNVPLLTPVPLYRRAEAEHGREALAQAERASEAEVLLATARSYYRVVGAQGVADAAVKALATAEDNLKVTRVKREAGTQTRLAVDRAQVDVARARQALVSAKQALAVAIRSLETLSGERVTERLPDPERPLLPAEGEAAATAEALAQRPELHQADELVRQQELAVNEAWALWSPSLSGTASETFTNATGFTGKSAYWAAGLSLTWTVDPWGTRAGLHRAQSALEEQRARRKQAQDSVRDEVHSAWLDVESGLARVEQSDVEVVSARDGLGITQQQYEAGTATSLDVSQAQRDAFDAEATLAQSRADLAAAVLALAKAAGEPLLAPAVGGRP
jgi:outer membrane protein